jgi:hypothetical protein
MENEVLALNATTTSGHWQSLRETNSTLFVSTDQYSTFCDQNKVDHWQVLNNRNVVETALWLDELDLRVVPVKPCDKKGYDGWNRFKYSRIPRTMIEYVFPGQNIGVICGTPPHHLFVVDCDSQETFADQLKWFGPYAAWVVSSARGGHIWFRSPRGVVPPYKGTGYEIWGANKYVLAPPSLHPTGAVYCWEKREGELPPILPDEILNSLFPRQINWRSPVDLLTKVFIHRDISGYKSNSEAEYAVVCHLVRKGYDDDQILELLEKYQPAHFVKQKCSREWAQKYYIDKARKFCPPKEQNIKLDNLEAWAYSRPWPGRNGAVLRSVFLACIDRARKESIRKARMSEREIAEHAGINRVTARNYLKYLCEIGWLRFVEQNKTGKYYAITKEPDDGQALPISTVCSSNGQSLSPPINDDIWRIGALGKSAKLIFDALVEAQSINGDMRVSDLADKTKKCKKTIKRILVKLHNCGMVYCEGVFWYPEEVTEDKLKAIARMCGTEGSLQRQKENHKKERDNFVTRNMLKQIDRNRLASY